MGEPVHGSNARFAADAGSLREQVRVLTDRCRALHSEAQRACRENVALREQAGALDAAGEALFLSLSACAPDPMTPSEMPGLLAQRAAALERWQKARRLAAQSTGGAAA